MKQKKNRKGFIPEDVLEEVHQFAYRYSHDT